MQMFRKIVAGMLLATCVAAQAQDATNQPSVRTSKAKATRTKPKTQEQILLEQLNEKFQKLDQLNQKYDDLQQKFDAMEKKMASRDGELEQARKDAATARPLPTTRNRSLPPHRQ